MMRSSRAHAKGFTLLEVMVALTITGLALGGLFGVIAGSKRLAWRAEQALVHSSQVRSLINFSQLNDEQGEVFIRFENDDLELYTGSELAMPERKTRATNEELRGFEITDEDGEVLAKGTYWMFPELPEMPAGPDAGNTDLLGNPAPQDSRTDSRVQRDANTPALGIRGIRRPSTTPQSGQSAPDPANAPGFFQ